MKRAVFGIVASGALAFACVDLFHSTEFDTLCDVQPDAAACATGTEAGVDVFVPPGHYDSCVLSHEKAQSLAHQACAWLGACLGPLGESQFGPCVIKAELAYDCEANPGLRPRGETDAFWSCLARDGAGPQSCTQIEECVFTKTHEAQDCQAVESAAFFACDSNGARVQCKAPGNGPPAAVEPCALSGRHCVATAGNASAFCVGGTTTDAPAAPACKGTTASKAGNSDGTSVDKGIDCANYGGGACISGSTAQVTCLGDGGSCGSITTGAIVCNGTIAQTCDSLHALPVDCAKLGPGLGCDATDASAPVIESACVPVGDAGEPCPAGQDDACINQGSTLQSCALGRVQQVRCADVGLGQCVGRDRGASCTKPAR